MEKKKRIIVAELSAELQAVLNGARNADSVDNLALEINTINPMKLHPEQIVYTLKTTPVNDKVKGKKKEYAPKVVGVKSICVETFSTKSKEGYVTINGTIDIPRGGNSVVKLEECLFESEELARDVAKVITEVELEKALAIRDEAQEAVDFIQKQLEDERF